MLPVLPLLPRSFPCPSLEAMDDSECKKTLFSKRNSLNALSLLSCHFASCILFWELLPAQSHCSRGKGGYLQCGFQEGQLAPSHIFLLKTEGTNTSSLSGIQLNFPKQTSGSVKAAAKCKEDLGCEEGSSVRNVGKGVNWEMFG